MFVVEMKKTKINLTKVDLDQEFLNSVETASQSASQSGQYEKTDERINETYYSVRG